MFVQFENDAELKVVSVFSGPQSPIDHPHQGEVSSDDQRYLDFVAAFAAAQPK